jgi:hypothetical protein
MKRWAGVGAKLMEAVDRLLNKVLVFLIFLQGMGLVILIDRSPFPLRAGQRPLLA